VPVSGERTARRIPFAAPPEFWADLLEEIDRTGPEMRFEVELTGESDDGLRIRRVRDLVSRGYSLQATGPMDWAVLVPRPTRVLSVVSPFATTADLPRWMRHIAPDRFRQHLLAVDTPEAAFADLASECAGESWHLDVFLPPREWAEFIIEFIGSREVDVVHVVAARLGVDVVPALRSAYPAIGVVVDVAGEGTQEDVWLTYVTARYGNVIDAFCTCQGGVAAKLERAQVPSSRIHLAEDHDGGPEEAFAALHEEVYGRLIAARVT
jgi:hypothetical protein